MLQNIKNYVKGFHGKTRNKVQNYFNRNWKETDTPVYWGTLAALCLLAGDSARELFPNPALGFVCGAALMFFGGTICFKFLNWLLERLRRVKSRQMISILALLIVSGGLGISGNLGNAAAEGLLFGIIFALALIWFIKSLWACFHNRVHTPTVFLTGCVSGCIFLSGCAFLAWDGFEDTYIEEYLALNEEFLSEREIEGFDRELQEGIYTVEALEYGTGKDVDVESETVDLSFCAQNPDGITGLWREAVSGYDVAKAPIAGKVWYPLELSDCPVLFFAHGNHGILTKSYLGYAYLGEYLASHGYVVVSVDENVLNMLSNENDARAILLLENMKKVQEFNRSEGNPLYGKMDYDNIVIGGHSRGGEMVSTAYLFNGYDCYPENGVHKFYYNFSIRGVIAVAPTVDQYMPAGHEVELENVNYLVLHGANDQDVNIFMGNTQYENVKFTEDNDYIKSSLYISGANHGQFNSLWGTYDQSAPLDRYLNVANFLEEEEQQRILKIYTKVFLDRVLKGEKRYETLLTDYSKYGGYLPKTVYIQQYQRSGSRILCDFEEDSDLLTASDETVSLDAVHMWSWREEMLYYSNEEADLERKNYALRLNWRDTGAAVYRLRMDEPVSLEDYGISFDICDMDEDSVEEGTCGRMLPGLVIYDSGGKHAGISLEDAAVVYPPLPVRLGKIQYLLGGSEYKHQFQTVSISARQLKEKCSGLELSEIEKIELVFPGEENGNVSIDNICLMKE